ncbi:MAG: nucleotidyltransferase domain-containing protein [Thermomicrobiales bacterium]|nr:nucleotidyltransferase domain-containing protein [Thermomicrobiales bacterium]
MAEHLDEIRALSEKYGVEKLEIFGSAMTEEFDPKRSDVDFIVHYPEGYDFGPFGKELFDFEKALSDELGRSAQLVMTKALKNPLFRECADQTRVVIYGSTEGNQMATRNSEALSVPR